MIAEAVKGIIKEALIKFAKQECVELEKIRFKFYKNETLISYKLVNQGVEKDLKLKEIIGVNYNLLFGGKVKDYIDNFLIKASQKEELEVEGLSIILGIMKGSEEITSVLLNEGKPLFKFSLDELFK